MSETKEDTSSLDRSAAMQDTLHNKFFTLIRCNKHEEAMSMVILGLDRGEPWATVYMGMMCSRAYGTTRNVQHGIELLTKSLEMKLDDETRRICIYELGVAYGFINQHDDAIKYLSRPELIDDVSILERAHHVLGYMYELKNQLDHAFKYYLMAGESGLVISYRKVGHALLYGKGTEKNLVQAESWFTRSVEAGEHKSYVELVKIAKEQKDHVKALRYLHMGVQQKVIPYWELREFYQHYQNDILVYVLGMEEQVKQLKEQVNQLTEENQHVRLYPGADYKAAMRDFCRITGQSTDPDDHADDEASSSLD